MKQKICTVCIMNDSDPDIEFFGDLGCNHCINMAKNRWITWFPQKELHPTMLAFIEKIKMEGKNKEYDSILGLSGGLDSSFLALKAYEWGLRPLVLHVDAGWNTELAVRNIQSIIDYTGWDLHTVVIDWEDMKELQLAYLKSGVLNQDVPQDHAFFVNLYRFAAQNKIKWILSGGNVASEGILPSAWHGVSSLDSKNLKYILKKFGNGKLFSYRTIGFIKLYLIYPRILRIKEIRPLNYIDYNLENSKIELKNKIGWQDYPRKHGESFFTRFFQDYYLRTRCSIDKRIAHFSSLIVSEQITRSEALKKLEEDTYSPKQIHKDLKFIANKLGISSKELQNYINIPLRNAALWPNWLFAYKFARRVSQIIFHSKKIFIK